MTRKMYSDEIFILSSFSLSLVAILCHNHSTTAPNIVLTAGHCDPGTTFYVRAHINPFNLVSPGSNYQVFQIEEIRVHPYFNFGTKLSNDFSLLRLNGSSPNPPVELNTVGSEPSDNEPLVVIGWGTTVYGIEKMPNFLQEVEVTAMTNTECRNDYGSSAVSPQMLCCDETGRGACQGDSGGPLIIPGGDSQSDVQVGTVSWGIDCALPGYPGKLLFVIYLSTDDFRSLFSLDHTF